MQGEKKVDEVVKIKDGLTKVLRERRQVDVMLSDAEGGYGDSKRYMRVEIRGRWKKKGGLRMWWASSEEKGDRQTNSKKIGPTWVSQGIVDQDHKCIKGFKKEAGDGPQEQSEAAREYKSQAHALFSWLEFEMDGEVHTNMS
ncbi:uncharacterized protein MEPE_06192 [Melanopsichium pennsylvanicum]|uniref:Uncharacterized protein n=1 Tax=Melanopsichium pennsylvanicum TaxID=63383 RepID=A0AAJ5C801_9BASI|nr:uncharacterized protein MEPE_06192 [Melanopsichium pennsylvanicum]